MSSKVGMYSKVSVLAGALFLVLSPGVSSAEAEAGNVRFYATRNQGTPLSGFFEKGSARTVFSNPAAEEERADVQFFPRQIPKEEKVLSKTAPIDASPAKLAQPLKNEAVQAEESPKTEPTTPEEKRQALIKDFGAPEQDAPVQVQDNAPKPFKAMMAALESGDDELAYKYARQYVRYMGRLQQRSTRVVGLMGTAMEREGMAEKGAWQSSKEFVGDRKFLDAELAANAERAPEQRVINEQASAMLAKARMMEEEGPAPVAAPQQQLTPQQERLQIRQQLAREVPIDPGAKVQVYFFFKPLDSESQRMGKELQSLFANARGQLDLMALSLAPMTDQEEKVFRSRTGSTYAINPDGSNIAKMMEVRGTPSTVLVSPRLNRAFAIDGARKALFVEEVMKMMEGR